ncbi:hypothetical protein C8F01DRAFT_1319470 [Mycena amicta]|nr:hypothetical protein C8F01DRAFT_1319470 [Mycena amicta]
MGDKKKAASRQSLDKRTTGKRKAPKAKKSKENDPGVASRPKAKDGRPLPRAKAKPVLKSSNSSEQTHQDEFAASLLLSMSGATVTDTDLMYDSGKSTARAPETDDMDLHDLDGPSVDDSFNPQSEMEEQDTMEISDSEGEEETEGSDDGGTESDEASSSKPLATTRKARAPKFNIPFELPFGTGTRSLPDITSQTPYINFIMDAAAKMRRKPEEIEDQIGYVPSYLPRSPKPLPKLLDEEAWPNLIADVAQFIEREKAKNRGKGVVKAFHILISIITAEKGKEKKKKGKGSARSSHIRSDDDLEGEGHEVPARDGDLEILREIEEHHHCHLCKKACVILDNGDHYIFTHADKTTWTLLIKRHKATVNEPPAELKLEYSSARQRRAKKNLQQSNQDMAPPPPPPPQDTGAIVQQIMTPLLAMFAGVAAGGRFNVEQPAPLPAETATADTRKRAAASMCDTDISSWLAMLQTDPFRNKNGKFDYQRFTDFFEDNGLAEISDIVRLSAKDLVELSNGMINIGMANRIVAYAKEDLEGAESDAKRARTGTV